MIESPRSRVSRVGAFIFALVTTVITAFTPVSAVADGLGLEVVVKTNSNSPTENNNFLWIASESG